MFEVWRSGNHPEYLQSFHSRKEAQSFARAYCEAHNVITAVFGTAGKLDQYWPME